MTHLLFKIPFRNILVRAGLGVVAAFLFFGLVTGALPVGCLTGGVSLCAPAPAVEVVSLPAAEPVSQPAALPAVLAPADIAPAKVVQVAAIEPVAPTLTHNELIARTFDLLGPGLQLPETENPDGALTTRKVTTVAIRADGTPDLPAAAVDTPLPELALPSAEPPAAPVKVADAGPARIAIVGADALAAVAEEDVPVAAPVVAKPAVVKVAVAKSGKTATVLGSGANVRSSPSKKGAVQFALAGGTVVTILENQRGWLHVKDAHGRDGWMYKDFVRLG